jgi:hypothetical protein
MVQSAWAPYNDVIHKAVSCELIKEKKWPMLNYHPSKDPKKLIFLFNLPVNWTILNLQYPAELTKKGACAMVEIMLPPNVSHTFYPTSLCTNYSFWYLKSLVGTKLMQKAKSKAATPSPKLKKPTFNNLYSLETHADIMVQYMLQYKLQEKALEEMLSSCPSCPDSSLCLVDKKYHHKTLLLEQKRMWICALVSPIFCFIH